MLGGMEPELPIIRLARYLQGPLAGRAGASSRGSTILLGTAALVVLLAIFEFAG